MHGMSVEWPVDDDPILVFVDRFRSPVASSDGLFLFGARYDIAGALFEGEPLADEGWMVEFFLVESLTGAWRGRRLAQRGDIAFSEGDDVDGWVAATEVDQAKRSLSAPPRWASAKSDAHWPTADGQPMVFLAQTRLPDNDVTRTLLSWNDTLYLFWLEDEGRHRFKLMEQDGGQQSVEDHYALEDEWPT